MVSCANRKILFDDSLHLGLEMNVFFQFRAPMNTLSMLKVIVLVGLHLYAIPFCPITTLTMKILTTGEKGERVVLFSHHMMR